MKSALTRLSRRSVSVLLSLLMVAGLFTAVPFVAPVTADAAKTAKSAVAAKTAKSAVGDEDPDTHLVYSGNAITGYNGTAESVTIPSSLDGNTITTIGDEAFKDCTGLMGIVIPGSVTTIGARAFQGCWRLNAISISNQVLGIEQDAFYDCSQVGKIEIFGFAGSAAEDYANNNPTHATFTPFTDPDTYCRISSNTLQSFKTTPPANLVLPAYDSSGNLVTATATALIGSYTRAITSVVVPPNYTTIGSSSFSGCTNLNTKDIRFCYGLEEIQSYAFRNTDDSSSSSDVCVIFPPSLKTVAGFDGRYFNYLFTSKVSITSGFAHKVTSALILDCTFYYVSAARKPTFSSTYSTASKILAFDVLSYRFSNVNTSSGKCTLDFCMSDTDVLDLTSTAPPLWIYNKRFKIDSIGDNAYKNNTAIKEVRITSGVTAIGDSAFEGCTELNCVRIGGSVTSIGDSAFEGCTELNCVRIGGSITSIGDNAFKGCTKLNAVSIPSSVSVGDIGTDAFKNCADGGKIKIYGTSGSGADTYASDNSSHAEFVICPSGVRENASYAVDYGYGLSTVSNLVSSGITLPSHTLSGKECYLALGNSNSSSSTYTFKSYKTSLISAVLPPNYEIIQPYTFYQCSKLASVVLPDNFKTIGASAFSGCSALTSINLPDSITDIGTNAFYNTALQDVTIPSGVTTINNSVFSNCTKLASVTIHENVTSIASSAFDGRPTNSQDFIIYGYGGTYAETYAESKHYTFVDLGADFVYTTLDGETTLTGYTGSMTNLKIPQRLGGAPVVAINPTEGGGIRGNASLVSIIIPSSVTTIGNNAFQNCTGLTSVNIPSGVTSIGDNVFDGCASLTGFAIPVSITSIGSCAFRGCVGLTGELSIPSSVTTMGTYTFQNCTGITEVTIPSSIGTTIPAGAFKGCSGIDSVTIPPMGGVTTIGSEAFQGCSALTYIQFPLSLTTINSYAFAGSGLIYLDMQDVTTLGDYAFSACTGLTELTLPTNATSMGNGIFQNCTGLDEVEIPAFLTTIPQSMFSGCTGLTDVVIDSGVTTVGSSAFSGCTSLTQIELPSTVTTVNADAFNGCSNLGVAVFRSRTISIGNAAFNSTKSGLVFYGYNPSGSYDYATTGGRNIPFYDLDFNLDYGAANTAAFSGYNGSLTSLTIPATYRRLQNGQMYSITSISDSAFSGKTSIRDITIPSSVTSIGESAFQGCTALTGVTIPNNVNAIGAAAFKGCVSLTSAQIPSGVTTINNNTFQGCTSLSSLTIPNTVATISQEAFEGCSGLAGVSFPASVRNIGESAFKNTGLTSVVIPNTVTSVSANAFQGCSYMTSATFYSSIITVPNYMFQGCSSLGSITIPSGITSIGAHAFEGCSALTTATVPGTVTTMGANAFAGCLGLTTAPISTGITAIPDAAFLGCSGLTEVTIPANITSIGSDAFKQCTNITEINIPSNVSGMGDTVFSGCTKLAEATFTRKGSMTSLGTNVFSGCASSFKIYAYKGSSAATYATTGNRHPFGPIYDIVYSYPEYDFTKAQTYVYDDRAHKDNESLNQTTRTYNRNVVKTTDDSDSSRTNAANLSLPSLTNNYYNYSTGSVTADGTNLNVTLSPNAKEYYLKVVGPNGTTYTVGTKYHYQTKVIVYPQSVGGSNSKIYNWYENDKLVAMADRLAVYITHNTTITAVENTSGTNPAPSTTITDSGYEFTLSGTTQYIRRNFYVQNFYHYSSMGLGNTFLGGGIIFRSTNSDGSTVSSGKATLTQSEMESILTRQNLLGGSANVDTTRTASDSTSSWTVRYIRAQDANKLVYSNALRAYHYIQGVTFIHDEVNTGKKLRAYSYYLYRNASSQIVAVVADTDKYADAAMYVN